MSVQVQVEVRGIARAVRQLNRMGRPGRDLMRRVGAVVEGQTRLRIAEEKRSPDGEAWPPWSDAYAATRHAGHSLLQDTNALLDSITVQSNDNSTEIGSNLIYARPNHRTREFLGLSRENRNELDDVVGAFIDRLGRVA